jgi:thiamine-phosphate pyrophosphorylase
VAVAASRPADHLRQRSAGVNTHDRLQHARLYVITPDRTPDEIVELGRAVLRGGADVLQLRQKALPRGALLELAHRLRDVTSAAGALFIVNDHVDVAIIAGADGVHLGPDDVRVESARRIAPAAFVIGASASTPDAAMAAVSAGADYIGSGPAFSTPIKREKAVIGPAGVAAVAAAVDVPVFAIGGVEESNVAQLKALGLRRICVIRAVADASDPEAATRRLRAMLDA